jgi:acetyl esterase
MNSPLHAAAPELLAPDDMAQALRQMGCGFNLPEVQALYAPLLAAQPRDGVRLLADLSYGAHARHRLDLFLPDGPAPADGWPVLVSFHGGGFIRGDKSQRANLGWHFARQGVATVVPNYRLAPESGWPCGPEDVVAVWQWLQGQAAEQGLNPCAIVLQGESAGAAHVAAATLLRHFHPADWQIAGAVQLSGPAPARLARRSRPQFGTATPDPRNDAYFGTDDAAALAAVSLVEQVDAAPFPLLISTAERDLVQMKVQAGELFARLVSQHGFAPELLTVRDHNHFSQGYGVGTGDLTLAQPLLDFVRRCWAAASARG